MNSIPFMADDRESLVRQAPQAVVQQLKEYGLKVGKYTEAYITKIFENLPLTVPQASRLIKLINEEKQRINYQRTTTVLGAVQKHVDASVLAAASRDPQKFRNLENMVVEALDAHDNVQNAIPHQGIVLSYDQLFYWIQTGYTTEEIYRFGELVMEKLDWETAGYPDRRSCGNLVNRLLTESRERGTEPEVLLDFYAGKIEYEEQTPDALDEDDVLGREERQELQRIFGRTL